MKNSKTITLLGRSQQRKCVDENRIRTCTQRKLLSKTAVDTEEELSEELTAEYQLEKNLSVSELNQDLQQRDQDRVICKACIRRVKRSVDVDANFGDERRSGFINKMEEFKNEERGVKIDWANIDRSYANHQSIEDKLGELEEVQIEMEQPRLKYVDAYDTYKDDMSKWNEGMSRTGSTKRTKSTIS